jgi:hypothetical protein
MMTRREYTLEDALAALAWAHQRATYGAVGDLIGRIARAVNRELLGEPRPTTSWVVRAEDGLPTGYEPDECDPNLQQHSNVISTAEELRRLIDRHRTAE